MRYENWFSIYYRTIIESLAFSPVLQTRFLWVERLWLVDAAKFLSWFLKVWLHLCAICWCYRDLFGTDCQFGNCRSLHSLSVWMNMAIAIFGTECVKKVKYNSNTKDRTVPNRCSKWRKLPDISTQICPNYGPWDCSESVQNFLTQCYTWDILVFHEHSAVCSNDNAAVFLFFLL